MAAWVLFVSAGGAPAETNQHHARPSKQLLWGDLHIHTAYSLDAYLTGTRQVPESAYRFARGEPRILTDGRTLQLERPLDFAAVTDHAEYFGVMRDCVDGESSFCDKVTHRDFVASISVNQPLCPEGERACGEGAGDLWRRTIDAAQAANEPGQFTTFIASEWSATPGRNHLHRNLIYAGEEVPATAINAFDDPTQEELWDALQQRCVARGCDVLAIPHNSNLSVGGTFRPATDSRSTQLRIRFERLAEIHQQKGQSECFPGSELSDEACAFEMMLPLTLDESSAAGQTAQIAKGYLRNAVSEGLRAFGGSGINPFRYGFVGSTDTHDALPGYVSEKGWAELINDRHLAPVRRTATERLNPGGLTAVWAQANTRGAIFAALSRREVYATSGTRIRLKFQQAPERSDDCAGAKRSRVNMGGEADLAPGNKAPIFFVHVLKDHVPIVRIDIVKLAFRDDRVQQSIATWDSSGRADWCVQWTDESFRVGEAALWYARVFEAASPDWRSLLQDAAAPSWVQERAWSSPIWSFAEPRQP